MKNKITYSFAVGYIFIVAQLFSYNIFAQTIRADTSFIFYPEIITPAYPKNEGPIVYLDEGHYNRHLYGGLGSFIAFKNVLIKDGYQVVSFKNQFTNRSLQEARLMVIALAQNEKNLGVARWHNPTYLAYEQSEIIAIKRWVQKGGSLFLIVDHHPIAGASKDLIKEFGFEIFNGHAMDTIRYPSYFNRANNTLHSNAITNGRNKLEKIDSVITYNGAAFKIPINATPILTFDKKWIHYLPNKAWDFESIEPTSIEGFSQGSFKKFGNGKFIIFADGNMFSAQDTSWGGKMGFIDPNAKNNYKLLINIIHFLDGLID